ncbi:hypothetical protein F5148DRAFT_864618 [Russula earlei]|uniref:Uncharacterized protein n=1 Tax=Russula earlei TaxID=71964 RepID=A0ACC0UBN1_9AGAM|nr:hypothetical protein F5148DRAFT_864618 [Russula earlei]
MQKSVGTHTETSTRHSSPSSPLPAGPRMKNVSFCSAAVHLPRHNRDTQTSQFLSSLPDATQASLPSSPLPPSAGRRTSFVDAQLAGSASGSGSAPVAPQNNNTNLFSSPHDFASSSSLLTSSSPPSATPKSSHPLFPSSIPSVTQEKQEETSRQRSSAHVRSTSRDVGIVGTVSRFELTRDIAALQDTPPTHSYRPPIFQTPSARTSSPGSSAPVGSTSPVPNLVAQTSSFDAAHVRPAAMSATVEPVHNASPAMNGHQARAPPHSARSLKSPSPSHDQSIGTPEQAQPSPVASPPLSTAPSSYPYHQHGVHSKTGPLPPPPRAMFDMDFNAPPPPRPPRLRSPSPLVSLKNPGDSTPTSVTVRLASRSSIASIHQIHIGTTPPAGTDSSSDDSEYSLAKERGPSSPDLTVHHMREGAFPPSILIATPAEMQRPPTDESIALVPEPPFKDQLPSPPSDSLNSTPSITVQPTDDGHHPNAAAGSPKLYSEKSWVGHSNDSGNIPSESRASSRHAFEATRPVALQEMNGSHPSIKEIAPDDSPSRPLGKGGQSVNLKRYSSLPRTPSTHSPRMGISTRSPSPQPRIRARSPDAMRFKDVLGKRSALERAIGYANKINELSLYDCGLADWVTSLKERGSSKTRLVPASPSQNSHKSLTPRARHASRASISSQATFPLRGDAYIATDLSQRDIDTVPSPTVPPPALPYPALAGIPSPINVRHSTTTLGSLSSHATAPLSAAASKATGGFFSSLGRNSSTRKDSLRPTQPLRLTRQSPPATAPTTTTTTTAPNPRPVQITSAPSVPGGPRALPNRVQRSRTLMLASSPPKSETAASSPSSPPLPALRRRSNTLKRPSFFGRSGAGPSPALEATMGADFTRQVERLADLLPHADKDVLAGYLRRAGQDILAIGQYLEDEKNGSVRAP